VATSLRGVLEEFGSRHKRLRDFFHARFEAVQTLLPAEVSLSTERKLLIGAYFSQEYSLEAAALFNPSIVAHPDQTGLALGELRFVLSLRATGEGHLSSITFRTGILNTHGQIFLETPSPFVSLPESVTHSAWEKKAFRKRIEEHGAEKKAVDIILNELPDPFVLRQLRKQFEITTRPPSISEAIWDHTASKMIALGAAHYEILYTTEFPIAERVIFPNAPDESAGIEDARFVRFTDEEQNVRFVATYTAYDGRGIHPRLLETEDFMKFRISPLSGSEVKNKGMALFPRKINGSYVMLSRQDGESLYLMFSQDLYSWSTKKALASPHYPWEFFQVGNCGSPIETERGWLVLTHGVGPMRKYSIGALLLDLNDPSKMIGRLSSPLLSPDENEREGYVPNVVYSCGALIHAGILILPYAMSDTASSFATVKLDELLDEMTS
jgi:predicted GH43/DUF377 family glycosyl hydrolase